MHSDLFGQNDFLPSTTPTNDATESEQIHTSTAPSNATSSLNTLSPQSAWDEQDRQRLETLIFDALPKQINEFLSLLDEYQDQPESIDPQTSAASSSSELESTVAVDEANAETDKLETMILKRAIVYADESAGHTDCIDNILTDEPIDGPDDDTIDEPSGDTTDTPNTDTATPETPIDPIEMTSAEIKALLDEGHCYGFNFNGQEYQLHKNEDSGHYEAMDCLGNLVDHKVRVEGDLTVEGYVEVGGLAGLGGGERLYIGVDDNNKFSMIVGSAELDANDEVGPAGSHRATLQQEGRYVYSGCNDMEPTEPTNPADTTPTLPEPPTESDAPMDIDPVDNDPTDHKPTDGTPPESMPPRPDETPLDTETPPASDPTEPEVMPPVVQSPPPTDNTPVDTTNNDKIDNDKTDQPAPIQGVSLSEAVQNSEGRGAQGTSALSLGGGNNPHPDVSDAAGHQVLVVIDDAMKQKHINNAVTALEEWTKVSPGLGFVVKLESELTEKDKNTGGLFLEATLSEDIDGYKGYADLGGRAGRFAHVRVATDTSQDEFVETWSHEIGHGLALEHNLGTGESPLGPLSVMSDNDKDKSKDAPIPTNLDAAALQNFGYDLQVDQRHINRLKEL